MPNTLCSFKLKLITGYTLLVMLFGVVLALLVYERRKAEQIDRRTEELVKQRAETERILINLLDLAFQGEQSVGWDLSDMEIYRRKSDSVGIALDHLRLRLKDSMQNKRIDSISYLLDQKEEHLFAVMEDVQTLREHYLLMQKRIPSVIRQTTRQSALLSAQLQENIEEERRQTGGFKGLFRNRKRTREQFDRKNDTLLQHTQNRQAGSLRALADEITRTHAKTTAQLVAHVDSLTYRNAILNRQLGRLVSEFGDADRSIREGALAHALFGHKRTFQAVFLLSIVALLCAMLFYILLHRDIRSRQDACLRLEKSHRHNAELLAARKTMMLTVSHDLRLPLAAICGYADLLPDAQRKESRLLYCAAIKESSERMLTLLNTLLDYYRLDTGKEQPDSRPFRLQSLTDALAAEYAPLAAKKQLELTTHYDGEDVIVAGDRERILQIAGNLLSNAVKFTRTGTIRLYLEYVSGDLLLRVEDTGAGMTEEQTKRIFEPFERLGNSETEEGFGLGLSITLALVELLKGRIDVQSRPGVGTTFTVYLPLPLCNEENLSPQPTEPNALPADLRVIVVENDAVLLAMTVEMFSRCHIHAEGCRSARELMECLRTQRYDLVLTDIMMPDVNGFGLLELLHTSNIPSAKTVPVVAMTARVERNTREFLRAGFAGCLYKPFSRGELFATVRQCIEKRAGEPLSEADFSGLFSGERNDGEMLALVARETKRNMTALADALERDDRESIAALTHQLLPLWEVLRIDAPLQDLHKALCVCGSRDDAVRRAVREVLAAGERLIEQARRGKDGNG